MWVWLLGSWQFRAAWHRAAHQSLAHLQHIRHRAKPVRHLCTAARRAVCFRPHRDAALGHALIAASHVHLHVHSAANHRELLLRLDQVHIVRELLGGWPSVWMGNAFCPLQLALLRWTTKQQHATPGEARHTKLIVRQLLGGCPVTLQPGAASHGWHRYGLAAPSSLHGAHTRFFNDFFQPPVARGGQLLNDAALAEKATPRPGAALHC